MRRKGVGSDEWTRDYGFKGSRKLFFRWVVQSNLLTRASDCTCDKMSPSEAKKTILDGIHGELKRIRGINPREWWVGMSRKERGDTATAMYHAKAATVLYEPSRWLSRPLTTAERKALSRALAELEVEGVIERFGDSRTVHVKLLGETA